DKIWHEVQVKGMVILHHFHQMFLEKLAVSPATRGIACPDFVPRIDMRPHKWLDSGMGYTIAIELRHISVVMLVRIRLVMYLRLLCFCKLPAQALQCEAYVLYSFFPDGSKVPKYTHTG